MPESVTAPPAGEGTPGPGSPLAIDGTGQKASWRSRRLDLSPTEFAVLACLHRQAGQAVTYDGLLQEVWGRSLDQGALAQVRNVVTRLRKKLAAAGAQACEIVAVRGTGYRLDLSLIVLLSVVSIIPLVGFNGGPARGDLCVRVWYHGDLLPLGKLLGEGVVPRCRDGSIVDSPR